MDKLCEVVENRSVKDQENWNVLTDGEVEFLPDEIC